ncbi:MAG TPA: cobalt transporter CbiM [Deltaproteobacteria bacterium]|nr:cobalt transporter CbiM [Deltaproteobacteria bacterium]
MHIAEGVCSGPVLVAGLSLAAAGVAYGIKRMDSDSVPKVGVLSSAFFVASLIHVPIGPVSTHLVLNGLMGLLLGWAAFPAIMVALVLQAVLFQYGGLTTLGVNTVNMAVPAVICFFLFGALARGEGVNKAALAGFACGFVSLTLSLIGVATALLLTQKAFLTPVKIVLISHIPIMVIEGIITAFALMFLKKVKPEIMEIDS